MFKRLLQSIALFCISAANAQLPVLKVDTKHPVASIASTQWGIFFEDINLAADGGLYAELVKNRSFEFNLPMMGWKELHPVANAGSMLVINRAAENPDNPRYLHVEKYAAADYGLSNEGFRGMGVHKGETYHFSVWARTRPGSHLSLRIELADSTGAVIGQSALPVDNTLWKQLSGSFPASVTDGKATLRVWVEGKGGMDMDMVSLFPEHTWKNRPGGLRADLVQLLADLHPGFIRFPGGCIVEGRDLANRYQWKKTVGPVRDRKLIINRWNTEFPYRSAPDYYQSFGLGFFEYFQLAEDIGASPLPILNCGMACQYNTGELVGTQDLDPYVQDALDLIEFANGSTDTRWGKLRASMGHPAPFHLRMMGVGNEQWGPQYIERYTYFAKAIKKKYPYMELVNSVGPSPDDARFRYLNDTLRKMHADILDEHYYKSPDWFLHNAQRYDEYDRKGPKIFAGEYAAHSPEVPNGVLKNNWRAALAEAAFMTGLERNAAVVRMASYAPLFASVDGWQWSPDLIWFNSLRSYGTPDYYVQKLYANNRGHVVLPVQQDGKVVAGHDSLYASAALDTLTHELIVKIAHTKADVQALTIDADRQFKKGASAVIYTMANNNLETVNSMDDPQKIIPEKMTMAVAGKQVTLQLPAYSFIVLKIPLQIDRRSENK